MRHTKLPRGQDDPARGTKMETDMSSAVGTQAAFRVLSVVSSFLLPQFPDRLAPSSLFWGPVSASNFHSNPRNRNATMGRHRDKLLHGAVFGICRDAIKGGEWIYSSFCPSQSGEENPPGSLETTVEVFNGSTVTNPITSGTADYASQADKLSLETAKPAEEFSGVTEVQVKAPAAVVDEGLISQPTPRRSNPTTFILPKINMEYAVEHHETVLYEKQRGQWVAEPLPEKNVERVAPTVPTYPNNGVLDFKRITAHA